MCDGVGRDLDIVFFSAVTRKFSAGESKTLCSVSRAQQ